MQKEITVINCDKLNHQKKWYKEKRIANEVSTIVFVENE